MKNILLVKGSSQYGRIDDYIDEIATGIRKLGCNTCVLDGWSFGQPMRYNYILSNYRFDVVLDVNGTLFDYGVLKNLPPGTVYGVYICDPPKALSTRLKQSDKKTIIFACDKLFCDYMLHLYPMVSHIGFMPLSGSFYKQCAPYMERTIDVVFTGSYRLPQQLKEQALARFEPGSVLARFVGDMLEDIIINTEYTLPQCLSRVLKKYNQSVGAEEFDELVGEFMAVDFYARFYYRDKLIRTLLCTGVQVHVFGKGWEDFQSEYKYNLIIHKGGAYAASKALANAKIALNVMPWFKDGFQERIASAMLSKAVAVTDESKYILDNFENNKELVIYSLKDIDAVAGRIKYLLAHPKEAARLAEAGYQKAQSHTWGNRAYSMLYQIEEEFGLSLIQEGEGKELEYEMGYPDMRTTILDAVYELQKMVEFAENDIGAMEQVSKEDITALIQKYERFVHQFSAHLGEMEMKGYIKDCIYNSGEEIPGYIIELFSVQCKAWISDLLVDGKGLKI